jgi:hypothetical protein
MAELILIGVCAAAIGAMTWWTARLLNAMRSRERVAERLMIDEDRP